MVVRYRFSTTTISQSHIQCCQVSLFDTELFTCLLQRFNNWKYVENNAQYDGGGIRLYSGNILAIKNTMLSGDLFNLSSSSLLRLLSCLDD